MNIREKCPCGQEIEFGHLSTRPDHDDGRNVALIKLAQWRVDHAPHHKATLEARVRQINESRPAEARTFLDMIDEAKRARTGQ